MLRFKLLKIELFFLQVFLRKERTKLHLKKIFARV